MSDDSEVTEENQVKSHQEKRDLTISDAYNLGTHIIYLQFAGRNNHPVGSPEYGYILESLESLQNTLLSTDTSLTVASQIEDFKAVLYTHYEGEDASTNINDELGSQLEQHAETWNQLLVETLAEERRLNVPNTGILDLEQLMGSPNQLFRQEVWESMDEIPRQDIIESCRALPMGCSTATVMVSLRAVEHYLRKWYEYETSEKLQQRTWGSVLDELMDIYVAEEDTGAPVIQQLSGVPSVLSNLYYLKEKRNQVSHPDESPSGHEAAITLFMVAGTIT